MKNKKTNKYVVICDESEVSDIMFATFGDANKFAKDCIQDGSNETSEVFELVSAAKFKMVATLVKD
jgi:hypothetical protein